MKWLVSILLLLIATSIYAADAMENHHQANAHTMDKGDESHMASMHRDHMMGPLGISMRREASGTSWQPDATPMSMIMAHALGWRFMFHGNVFVGGQIQGSRRGDNDFNSINWFMAMANHALWSGDLSIRTMVSLEPLTMRGSGYPLLLQTGEMWKGEPLHDRQHPHDMFMELAVKYAIPVHHSVGLEFYGGLAGEPALGPSAFPHRASARSNPLAPLGHHWYDATHITFGVLTLGIYGPMWKAEGSWFNGREPDENRFNIELRPLDSFSGRLSLNPAPMLSLQASYGYLKSPEYAEPDISIHRITSSVSHAAHPWTNSNISSSFMVGINLPTSGSKTYFALLESDFDLNQHHTIFGRAEYGNKTGHDLVLDTKDEGTVFGMSALSLGYAFRFPKIAQLVLSISGVGTLNLMGPALGAYYGGPAQLGAMVFANLRPADVEQ